VGVVWCGVIQEVVNKQTKRVRRVSFRMGFLSPDLLDVIGTNDFYIVTWHDTC
jgi:hypothetical protein